MKKLNSKGYKISSADKKALEHFLNVSANEWARNALKGMINKAVKTILKDYFELYKSKQTGSASADKAVIIPAIVAMPEFKPYNRQTPAQFDKPHGGVKQPKDMTISRKEPVSEEIWEDGFDVEDYELAALEGFYADPEAQLEWLMTNKIYQRRCAFVKEQEAIMLQDPEVKEIPACQDDLINCVCAKPGYKNRVALEAEEQI
jgi:hypothetical protein